MAASWPSGDKRGSRESKSGGIAWSFVTPEQGDLLTNIEKLTNVEITRVEYDDFEPGPVPPQVEAERQRAAEREATLRERYSRAPTAPPDPNAVDTSKFPGGVVPVARPEKRMGGRLRTRRR